VQGARWILMVPLLGGVRSGLKWETRNKTKDKSGRCWFPSWEGPGVG